MDLNYVRKITPGIITIEAVENENLQDQIRLWAIKVERGKMTREDFDFKVHDLVG